MIISSRRCRSSLLVMHARRALAKPLQTRSRRYLQATTKASRTAVGLQTGGTLLGVCPEAARLSLRTDHKYLNSSLLMLNTQHSSLSRTRTRQRSQKLHRRGICSSSDRKVAGAPRLRRSSAPPRPDTGDLSIRSLEIKTSLRQF